MLFLSQIKTKQRYMWTKREATEEGSALGELVDQVSLLTVHQSGSEGLCLLEMCFVCVWFLSLTYSSFLNQFSNFPTK